MRVEIAHFYLSQPNCPSDVDHLGGQRFAPDDELFMFIDDIHGVTEHGRRFNVEEALAQATVHVGNRPVSVRYEATLCPLYQAGLDRLDQMHVTHLVKGRERLRTFYKGCEIFDYTLYQPSCQMLSYLWSLERIGAFCDEQHQILTVIDKRYSALERRVYDMLPDHLKHLAFYRFF